MSRYYNVFLNSGTSPGPYTIYYDLVNSGNIPYIMGTTIYASGLTNSQLGNGVTVMVPDETTSIILHNDFCDTIQSFPITPIPVDYGCICIAIYYDPEFSNYNDEFYQFCYVGVTSNGKPQYQTNNNEYLTWNSSGGYWEFQNQYLGFIFRSNDNDNIPNTSWYGVGNDIPDRTFIVAASGSCYQLIGKGPINQITLSATEPTCQGLYDGSINALATGGEGGWSYSLDNINFSNMTGIFTSLGDGIYTVYAKDIGGNTISDVVTLNGNSNITFNIVGSQSITSLPSVGNMKYYMATIVYNTNNIPVGESVTFDYNIVYNLEYIQPGSVIFDTSQHYLTLNGNPISISQLSSVTPTINGVSPCNSIYNRYVGQDDYIANNITLINGDVFSASIIYGIDTKTNGLMILPCYTSGNVSLELYFNNITLSCNCCSLLGNSINVSQPAQIYQP